MSSKVLVVDDSAELVDLLASVLEARGFAPIRALRGKQAVDLANSEKPRLAIIDILLPDMVGHKVHELVQQVEKIPTIFITGVFKGGRHALDAKKQPSVVGYFEKPFDANQLVALVEKHLGVQQAPQAHEPKAQEGDFDYAIELETIEVEEVDVEAIEIEDEQPPPRPVTPPPSAHARPEPHSAPAKPVAPAAAVKKAPGVRRGNLREHPLPKLINAFHLMQQTGELGVQRGSVKKVIYFEQGAPVFALSNLLHDRFGQYLLRKQVITEKELQLAVEEAAKSKRRTGDVLVSKRSLSEHERLSMVREQIKEIIYSIFAWEQGEYSISFYERARNEKIKLDVFPANMILRGVKKYYTEERLAKHIDDSVRFSPAPDPAYQLHEIELLGTEAILIARIDGTKSVADLAKLAGLPRRELLAILFILESLKIVERVE